MAARAIDILPLDSRCIYQLMFTPGGTSVCLQHLPQPPVVKNHTRSFCHLPLLLSYFLFPFSRISLYLPAHPIACQSKMLNFSTRGLHVQTMLEHSHVYKDDVILNLEVRYLWHERSKMPMGSRLLILYIPTLDIRSRWRARAGHSATFCILFTREGKWGSFGWGFCYVVFNSHMSNATEVQLWKWCFYMKFLLFMRPIQVWRSRMPDGVRCGHFPSVITTIMDRKVQLLKP
jgi:hypothetical protein